MAMTREQICVEQSNLTSQGSAQYGVNVWLPLIGGDADEWVMHEMYLHSDVDGVSVWSEFGCVIAKCKPGAYIPVYVGAAGITFPGGNWTAGNVTITGTKTFRHVNNATIEARNMRLTMPIAATRLYMIGYEKATLGTMAITKVSGDATIVAATVEQTLGGTTDFTDMDSGGGPNYATGCFKLIATNCSADDVLNFIGDGGDACGCCGFVAINDAGDAAGCNPYDGVFDPTTFVKVMPFEASGRIQEEDGPLSLSVSGGAAKWWGLGVHWDADDTGINEVQTLYFQDCADNSWVDWTSVDTAHTHVRKKAWSFGRVLTCDMQYDIGGVDTDVGDHISVYTFTPTGLTITLDHVFNAAAAAGNLEFAGNGGYGGQWSIAKGFGKYVRILPGEGLTDALTIDTGTFTNEQEVSEAVGNYAMLYGGTNGYEVHIQGEGCLLTGGGTRVQSSPSIIVHERNSDSVEWIKIYLQNQYVDATVAIAAGDRAFSKHTRMVAKRNALASAAHLTPRISTCPSLLGEF